MTLGFFFTLFDKNLEKYSPTKRFIYRFPDTIEVEG